MRWSILWLIVCSSILVGCGKQQEQIKQPSYSWNGGHCTVDGGRLEYDKVGTKYHYKCSICGKDYTFDRAMSYKED